MKTITVLIENSDDRLSQFYWSQLCGDIVNSINATCDDVLFIGYTNTNTQFQTMAVTAIINDDKIEDLRNCLRYDRRHYQQDSIALVIGEIEFIK